MIEVILISLGVLGTCFINYQLFNVCIKKAKYDDIPELNEIKKEMEKEKRKSERAIKKIINDVDINSDDEDFYIVKEIELVDNKD